MSYKPAIFGALAIAAGNALACYTVYDPSSRIVYNAQTSPVDMAQPLHQTLPRGYHMVFDGAGSDCPRSMPAPRVAQRPDAMVPVEISNVNIMGAGPAPRMRSSVVITEMRDPPITVIQRAAAPGHSR